MSYKRTSPLLEDISKALVLSAFKDSDASPDDSVTSKVVSPKLELGLAVPIPTLPEASLNIDELPTTVAPVNLGT